MADGLARVLSKPGFDSKNFVNKLVASGGEDELLDMKQKVQMLNDETAQSLKKNVYKHYSQFIETAREISILEGEMYQLSHMFTDQKIMMSAMMEMSLISDKAIVEEPKAQDKDTIEEDTRKNLAFLLEKVEGCSSVTEVPGRQLIHNGDLTEVDPESFSQQQRVHAFLLNDSLMIANWLPNRRGPVRYRFQGLYELDSLAVVNVRDMGQLRNAFKILMFPESRMYQADSAKSKRQWLDVLEETKKKKAARDKQKRESALRLIEQSATPVESEPPSPFEEEIPDTIPMSEPDFLNEDWLQELPENLDMCIAQRHFEDAVDLIEKVNEYLDKCPKTPALKEFRARIDHRVKQLTEGLMSELRVSPERSLSGGCRFARHAVKQLIRLGKSAQACDLFLKNRSAIIKYNIRQLKFEGATPLYIERLCSVMFSCLAETSREFTKAFPDNYSCYSVFVVWTKEELNTFVATFNRQVFGGKSNLSTIVECINIAKQNCFELYGHGLDLSFIFECLIVGEVKKVIEENQDQLIEAIKFRSTEDTWRPMNLMSRESCIKFLREMESCGVEEIKENVYDICFISLTENTASFAKSCLPYCKNVLQLNSQELNSFITESICALYKAQIKHIESSMKSRKSSSELSFILKNAQFILECVLSKIEKMYKDKEIDFPDQLLKISNHYRKLKTMVKV